MTDGWWKERWKEGKKWNRNKGEREEGSKQLWWATMILSSTAKIWGHVLNPIIPSSASESEDYKTVRGLVWYLRQPLTLQKQKLSPIDEKTPSYRHKDSTNGWVRPESRCLGPRPSSLHQPKSSPDSQNDLGVTITSSNTPQMGWKEGKVEGRRDGPGT